jgi:hypothetical protein
MSSQTIFMSVPSASAVVYRVETESGAYLLGLQGADGRRSVLVRGAPGTKHEHVVLGDTAPQVGTRSLWEVPVADWPGHPLTVATMTASRIRTVTRETDPGTVHALMLSRPTLVRAGAAGPGAAQSPPPASGPPKASRPAYPESHVQYAEDASALLRAVLRKEGLLEDLADEPLLRERLHHALRDALLVLQSLGERMRKP